MFFRLETECRPQSVPQSVRIGAWRSAAGLTDQGGYQPSVWSADKERDTVSIAGDAERPPPNARRDVPGRPEG